MILLVDTSVIVKWLHEEDEPEVEAARSLLDAHRRGLVTALVLDLAVYELGNVLLRSMRQPAGVVREHVALLLQLCGPVVQPAPSWYDEAADLAARHGLTFYDACWAASAVVLACPLVTADRALLRAGLAVSATDAAAALPA